MSERACTIRPEWLAANMAKLSSIIDVQMVSRLAPGDAVVRYTFNKPLLKVAVRLLLGLDCTEMRHTVRRDYPRQDMMTITLTPPNPGGLMQFQDYMLTSYYMVIEGIGEEANMVSHFLELPWSTFPGWAAHFVSELAIFAGRFPRRIPEAKHYYVVLCLQSCSRGPPLLPCKPKEGMQSVLVGPFAWVPANPDGFNFPEYLENLLEALEVTAPVWGCLDGRKLVPYQACMRGSDWELVSPRFAELFQHQRAAYRLLHGGKNAPKVKPAAKPNLLNAWTTDILPLDDTTVLEERNTFLSISEPLKVPLSGLQTRRPAEYP
eukprot:CAMPEP_0206631552 /NCGR_PEP_ID=MMETSP0325_2-20121206/68296_1 /ASSEMBLY_ACC=CAM_ASM_000347 /TAXON_ID=2866 /ORGANISM="Crypthecodinium cohnii, Strain Seligo" /LENGTH=319 /DNA_ID=CAMNT_0054156743 /DNA_START=606 /DNA_END=1565 /DNA_ORIENTATION=-